MNLQLSRIRDLNDVVTLSQKKKKKKNNSRSPLLKINKDSRDTREQKRACATERECIKIVLVEQNEIPAAAPMQIFR